VSSEVITRFSADAIAYKIAIALAVGMLVGFERESASKDAGIRTFGLTALLGALTILISPAFALVAMLGVIVVIALLNVRSLLANHSLEITTSAALLVTYALGVLVGMGHRFTPVAAAILMTLLLAWKMELRRFAGGVTIEELRSAVLLGLIGLVIYPILPDRYIDRWHLVNPRQAWITVVVIAGIAFLNYVLLRLYSSRGLYWTAVLGGLVNSNAALAELMSAGVGSRAIPVVFLVTIAMFVRNIAILALFAPKALLTAVGPIFAMGCIALLSETGKADDEPGRELALSSPVSLRRVLFYGALFLTIQVVGTLAQRHFGNLGFMVASMIAGFASSASATAAAGNLASSGTVLPALAGTATVLASMASAITNLPLIFKRLPGPMLKKIAFSTALQIAIGTAVLAIERFWVIH